MRGITLMSETFWKLHFNTYLKAVYFWDYFIFLVRLHKVRMDQADIPKGRHKNKPAFETTHFCEQIVLSSNSHSQLGVLPNSFFFFLLVLVKYNMLLETASWKHKLQSHVPLLYSSSTCNLGAKISKLATPNSPKGAQAGIGTRAMLGSPATRPHISYSGWHLPMDQNKLITMGICHHQQSNKFRLCNRYKVKVRNVHVTQRGKVAGAGPDRIRVYIHVVQKSSTAAKLQLFGSWSQAQIKNEGCSSPLPVT